MGDGAQAEGEDGDRAAHRGASAASASSLERGRPALELAARTRFLAPLPLHTPMVADCGTVLNFPSIQQSHWGRYGLDVGIKAKGACRESSGSR